MYITFGVYGEYDEYFGLNLNCSELNAVQKFIEEANANLKNTSIHIVKTEEDKK